MDVCIASGGYGGGAGVNKRKGMRAGDAGREEDYMGTGRFGGPLDREMQFFEKVSMDQQDTCLTDQFKCHVCPAAQPRS